MVRQGQPRVRSDGVRLRTIPRQHPIQASTRGGMVREAGLPSEEVRTLLSRPRPLTSGWSGRGDPRGSPAAFGFHILVQLHEADIIS